MSIFLPYENLKARIDEKFDQISSKYPKAFHCQSGCHQCCHPDLTLSLIEALALIDRLKQDEALALACVENEKQNPFQSSRCAFLNPHGQCMIYEFRPTVCRTHGAPLLVEIEDQRSKKSQEIVQSSCELNFTQGLKIQVGDWFNQHTLATMIGLFNQYFEEEVQPRFALKPSVLIAQQDLLIKYEEAILRAKEEIEEAKKANQEKG
jgi:Fe-S-cluster containining protein